MSQKTFDVAWTHALEVELRQIWRKLRYHTPMPDTSTPELAGRAVEKEERIFQDFLKKLRVALDKTTPAVVDLEVTGAVQQLQSSWVQWDSQGKPEQYLDSEQLEYLASQAAENGFDLRITATGCVLSVRGDETTSVAIQSPFTRTALEQAVTHLTR